MTALTTITITAADLLTLARAKGLLPADVTPGVAVYTDGWKGTTLPEVVQLSFTVEANG